jgi:hypothetical protein
MAQGEEAVHQMAQRMVRAGKTEEAWKILLAFYGTSKNAE